VEDGPSSAFSFIFATKVSVSKNVNPFEAECPLEALRTKCFSKIISNRVEE
jgi:hypothetical protein